MQLFRRKPLENLSAADALPGRAEPILAVGNHLVLGTPLVGPCRRLPASNLAMGCFGAPRSSCGSAGRDSTFVG